MIRNVIIINDYAYVNGGVGNVSISSALGLAERGLNVYLFTAVGPVSERLKNSSVNVICLNQYDILNDPSRIRASIQGIWNFKAKKQLNDLMKRLNPEETVIHFHGWMKALSGSLFSSIAPYNVKIFDTLHEYFIYCPNGGLYNYKKQIICTLKPMGINCVLCNCDSRNYMQKVWRTVRLCIHNIFFNKIKDRVTFISISNLTERICRREFGNVKLVRLGNMIDKPDLFELVKDDRNKYLFMARLSPEKGLDMFCDAITKLNLSGLVLGDGPLLDEYKYKYPNVDFVGWVDSSQKSEYLKMSKAFVFSSKWYEPFGLTVPEMMSLGIPCIVSDKSGVAEIVKDGINGFVFETGNVDSLCNALQKMEDSDLLDRCDQIKKSFDLSERTLEFHIDELIKLYNS
ncbi:MAG: glycosyltransferase family 4 protein [Paludibacteraceae bacterium]|nr:glycosyltransferase family 4 protein [Paludibacteraceae bacterium]